jgi:hypothetical protein
MESPGTADGGATGHEDEVARNDPGTRALSSSTEAGPSDRRKDDGNEQHDNDDNDDDDGGQHDESDEDEEDEEEEEEEEPRLKYAYLTRHLSSLYRNGDATSTFLTGGDKMVCYLVAPGHVSFGLTGCL